MDGSICKIGLKSKVKKIFTWITLALFALLSVLSITCGIISSVYALENKKIDEKPVKCLTYIIERSNGSLNWVKNQSLKKQKEVEIWYSKMLNKAYKNNGEIKNYYCKEVGLPTLLFAILPFFACFAFILFVYLINIFYF